MAEHYYTVGVHGAPTPETAPHGFFYVADGDWTEQVRYATGARVLTNEQSVWWPAPAPPTEQAPAPEPVKRWRIWLKNGFYFPATCPEPTQLEAKIAADALNALDRDGVAWGPGRSMEELPDGHRERVLLVDSSGHTWIDSGTHRGFDEKAMRAGWWPLPLPREAR